MSYQIPLFPLPSAVLFPRTHMGLHIFEPRYRLMMEEVMSGRKQLGFAHLREGHEEEYFGAPPIHRTLTAARVLDAEKLHDGRWNLIIEGIERVNLLQEVQIEPFRIGEVTPVLDQFDASRMAEIGSLTDQVAEAAEHLGEKLPDLPQPFANLRNTLQHPSIICDVVSAAFVRDPYARQSILEETDLPRRLKLLRIQLLALADGLREDGVQIDLFSFE